jgi:phosphatidylinositol glycan class W
MLKLHQAAALAVLVVPRQLCTETAPFPPCALGFVGFLGAAILSMHEYLLSGRGLIAYVHSEPARTDLLTANKEGLLSLPGYVALHLLSICAGHVVATMASQARDRAPQDQVESERADKPVLEQSQWRMLACMALLSACLWWAHRALAGHGISRRACNAPYVVWTLALNVQSLLLFFIADCLRPGRSPALYSAMGDYMTLAFLVANVLTGLVNMTVDTLGMADAPARLLVCAYITAVCAGTQWVSSVRQ